MPLDYNYTGTNQSLAISEVTDLQTNLDLKANEEDLESVSVDVGDLQTQLLFKANLASPSFTGTVLGITKAMVGLSEVENTSDANKPISDNTLSALNYKAPINNPGFTGTVSGITKSMVDLGNVDNIADADKVISNLTQTALNLKADETDLHDVSIEVSSNMDEILLKANITALTTEIINRSAADATLQTNINTETTARTNGDAGLQTSLNAKADTTALSTEIINRASADLSLQSNIDLKSNIASPSFTGTSTFTKADNYGQIELTDSKPVAEGVGGGITMNGVYGGSGQTTGLAHIKAKKSNSTTGDYHGDLSLSVREHGGGDYTEVIKLRGEDLKTILNGGLKVVGSVINIANIPTSNTGLATGDVWSNSGVLTIA